LQSVGRTDIPIGIGISTDDYIGPQYNYAADYSLSSYPGKIFQDGVQAMIDVIHSLPTVTVLELAPATNFAVGFLYLFMHEMEYLYLINRK